MDEQERTCGAVDIRAGSTFVCVRPPHAKVYFRRKSDRTHHKGDLIFISNKQADQHVFVKPNT